MYKKKYLYAITLLILLNLGMIIHFFTLKTTFHVDELFSYGHANSSTGAYLVLNIDTNMLSEDIEKYLTKQWLVGSVFHNYLTVQPKERFRYKHIFENLAVGVHPPLFYILLHTICSFTPDIFSKWQGAVLNIPIWIILLMVMYKLSRLFFEDKYLALLPVVFYAYSQIGFNTVIFIRGYLLQTLWATSLVYETTKMIQEHKTKAKRWILIFLFSLLGMLTQYNSVIFSAIVGVIMGLNLLVKKRYKDLMIFAGVMLLSLAGLFILFPQILEVLSHANRVKEVQDIGHQWFRTLLNLIMLNIEWKSSEIYTTKLWSFSNSHNGMFIEVWILYMFYKYKYTSVDRNVELLIVISMCMFVFCSIYMPQMHIYNMRYIMLIMPLFAIYTIWSISFILQIIIRNTVVIKVLLSVLIFVNSWFVDFNQRSPYAFQWGKNIEKRVQDKNIIWIGDSVWMLYGSLNIAQEASNVFLTLKRDEETIEAVLNEINQADYLINFNHHERNKYDISVKPKGIARLDPMINGKLTYEMTIKIGEWFYDIYKVKKHDHKLQGKTQ